MRRFLFLLFVFLALVTLFSRDAVVAAPSAGPTERVSVNSDGAEANNESFAPDMTDGGRYVVFESTASNLVSGDNNNARDIFVYDRDSDEIERVSIKTDGGEANFDSYAPAISDDGRIVVFHSFATNLVDGDTNNVPDVFFHNRETGNTKLISVVLNGVANDVSYDPDISADGRYVVFWSHASNLVANDNNGKADIFRYDRIDEIMVRVSIKTDGAEGNGDSTHPTISADGQRIAFESLATNLVDGDGNGYKDIFIRNLLTGETKRISLSSSDAEANGESFDAAISGNGLFVTFVSLANNLVAGDTNDYPDVFLRDRPANVTERVSVATDGAQANEWCEEPFVSEDGRYVAFQSYATTLVGGDPSFARDVFVRDRATDTTVRASVDSNGVIGNESSREPVLSGNGELVVFSSKATNLVSGDNNGVRDIFVHDLIEPPPPPPPPPATVAINYTYGAPGSAFTITGANFTANNAAAVWVNGVSVGAVATDATGSLSFRLSTTAATDEGGYLVTVILGSTLRYANFMLDAAAPLRPLEGSGPIFAVPDNNAYDQINYFPVVGR